MSSAPALALLSWWESIALVIALPVVLIWTIGFCVAGTVQAMNCRSVFGQRLQARS